ncbi:VOC family protein [Sphingobium nicotianae]|uniref:VOC family protein n=1 Tax=Sphingobium nicotianae TaxID=2782607 RepID=A0A9X1DDM6_9SPHN|nr:VOC family protein [Sphingobium nicotianae]MBT2187974.1 VOC family protein [Sphingobium nicotianae]
MSLLSGAKPVAFVPSRDVAALLPFYRDTLGLTLIAQDDFAATFDLGGGATLRLAAMPDHKPAPGTVLGWVVSDLDMLLDRLAPHGVRGEIFEGFGQDARGIWTVPDGSARLIWFRDPEGNLLSLTQLG